MYIFIWLLKFHTLTRISGVTGVEILAGLHWYLKNLCNSHISWDKTGGAQLFSVPKSGLLTPVQDAGILVQRPVPWNYYQNAVTSSCKLLLWHCFTYSRFQSSNLGTFLSINWKWSFLLSDFLKIHSPGGIGKDGRRRLTGWPFKGSICH